MWTARQNLEYVALLYNLSKQEMMKRIGDVVGRVGLGDRVDEIYFYRECPLSIRQLRRSGTAEEK